MICHSHHPKPLACWCTHCWAVESTLLSSAQLSRDAVKQNSRLYLKNIGLHWPCVFLYLTVHVDHKHKSTEIAFRLVLLTPKTNLLCKYPLWLQHAWIASHFSHSGEKMWNWECELVIRLSVTVSCTLVSGQIWNSRNKQVINPLTCLNRVHSFFLFNCLFKDEVA